MTDVRATDEAAETSHGASRLHIPIHLRWGDLDAFNHVNNTSMLKLLEEARVRAFWEPDAGEPAPDTAVLDSSIYSGVLTLIARQLAVALHNFADEPARVRFALADEPAVLAAMRAALEPTP